MCSFWLYVHGFVMAVRIFAQLLSGYTPNNLINETWPAGKTESELLNIHLTIKIVLLC